MIIWYHFTTIKTIFSPSFKCFINTLMLLFVCVCVSQVFCVQLYPTWTGRPRTSTWCCFRPRTWGDTWADYPGPPPSPSSSPTSTTILRASPRVSYSAAHAATHSERMTPRNRQAAQQNRSDCVLDTSFLRAQ